MAITNFWLLVVGCLLLGLQPPTISLPSVSKPNRVVKFLTPNLRRMISLSSVFFIGHHSSGSVLHHSSPLEWKDYAALPQLVEKPRCDELLPRSISVLGRCCVNERSIWSEMAMDLSPPHRLYWGKPYEDWLRQV
jgi:hypothetical protein